MTGVRRRCAHPNTPENTSPDRGCRICRNARMAAYMRGYRGGYPYNGPKPIPLYDPWPNRE